MRILTVGVATAGLLAVGISAAIAGPRGQFLCGSDTPYTYVSVDDSQRSVSTLDSGRVSSQFALPGTIARGQSPKIKSPNGLALLPVEGPSGDVVQVVSRGNVSAQVPGQILDWDLTEAQGGLAYFTTYARADAKANVDSFDALQVVVDRGGQVLASKKVKRTLSDNASSTYRFTADGTGIYAQPDPDNPSSEIVVLDSKTLQEALRLDLPEALKVTSLSLSSSRDGLFVAGNRLFAIRNGSFSATPLAQTAFHAQSVSIDPRSQRAVVNGIRQFAVVAPSGDVLATTSFDTKYPVVTDAKLAIDGSVAYTDLATGAITLRSKGDGYREATRLPVAKEDWHQVQCFTANSAAMTVDGAPKLVKFGTTR